jgi:hypothetical protein
MRLSLLVATLALTLLGCVTRGPSPAQLEAQRLDKEQKWAEWKPVADRLLKSAGKSREAYQILGKPDKLNFQNSSKTLTYFELPASIQGSTKIDWADLLYDRFDSLIVIEIWSGGERFSYEITR